ncbi:hypothetical protein FQR65_LT19808 [Abscondita terminalis]|nr:hypothetical protein FQR65_LT19808 [Abscondita terminalis]
MGEAQKARADDDEEYPEWKVDRVILDKEFSASRDAAGRGFMSSLFDEVANLGLSVSSCSDSQLIFKTSFNGIPNNGSKIGALIKAANELLKASNDFRKVSSDISKFLNKDEKQAYDDAVARGVIDVTQAHDLAGIAQGEDSGIMWKTRPIMRAASVMFHSAERFNRELRFIAAYRLRDKPVQIHDLI